MRLEFGERRFDGIEVGTIGRQVTQSDASSLENLRYSLDLVGGQIVQNQRVASLQAGHEHLLEIHQENLGVDRPVHQKRGGNLVVAQGRQKGGTLPMTVRDRAQATFAPGTATV